MATLSAWRHSPSTKQITQKALNNQYANPHKLSLPLTLSATDSSSSENYNVDRRNTQEPSLLENQISKTKLVYNNVENMSIPKEKQNLRQKVGNNAIETNCKEKMFILSTSLPKTSITSTAYLKETIKEIVNPLTSSLPSDAEKNNDEESILTNQIKFEEPKSKNQIIMGSDFTNTLDMRKKSLEQNVSKGKTKQSKVISYEQQGKVHELRNKFTNLMNQNEQGNQFLQKISPLSTKSNSPGLDAPDSGIIFACNK